MYSFSINEILYKKTPQNYFHKFVTQKYSIDYGANIPATFTEASGAISPQFGRTQYLFGAVVLTLKQTFYQKDSLT